MRPYVVLLLLAAAQPAAAQAPDERPQELAPVLVTAPRLRMEDIYVSKPPPRTRYGDYTRAREAMLKATHTAHAPWTLVDFNDQKRGRLTLLRDLLDRLPDTRIPEPTLEFPPLPRKPAKERYGVLKPIAPFTGTP